MDAITLDDIPLLWRAESLVPLKRTCRSTGYPALDDALGGGWPIPSLIELLCDEQGIGELRLLLGLLDPCDTDASHAKTVLWLAPPFELHAISLAQHGLEVQQHWVCAVERPADLHWAMTQALRSGACHAVIGWASRLPPVALRSIKLAASAGQSVGVLFRPARVARTASPATARLQLTARPQALEVSVLKAQGRRPRIVLLTHTELGVHCDLADS